jgi:hypothetical protein
MSVMGANVTESPEVGQSGIQKARFFLNQLNNVEVYEPFDPVAAAAYLEAAMLFGKNAQYAIEKNIDRETSAHWNDPICEFVSKARNVIVHEDGSAEVTVKTGLTVYLNAAVMVVSGGTATLTVTPPNPKPWQRLYMRWQDHRDRIKVKKLRRKEEARVKRLRARLQEEAAERARRQPSKIRRTKVHFVINKPESLKTLATKHPELEEWAASQVVSHYLDILEQEILDLNLKSSQSVDP